MVDRLCEYSAKCPFYNELQNDSSLQVLARIYCEAGFEKCARYILRSAGGEVPPKLWPDGVEQRS